MYLLNSHRLRVKPEPTILIYGGAFNPPHLGHKKALEIAAKNFDCQEIWLMPSADRKDKTISTSSNTRLAMLKIFISELAVSKKIKISKLEINNKKLSSTFETTKKLKTLYPNYLFYFVIGSDIIEDIEKFWVQGKKVFNSVNFLILKRPGYDMPKKLPKNSVIIDKEIIKKNISSTAVRKAIKMGEYVEHLLTPKIKNYIIAKKLYL